ncbi:transcriptional regulator [Rossellomorea marisflavi]|nr:transcriptional regulator [Rossellomorea marisflavi]
MKGEMSMNTWEDPESLAKHIGTILRDVRGEQNLSLQALADLTGVSKLTLGNIERGEANPSLTIIWKIANGLSIPISSLLMEKQQVKVSRKNEGSKVLSADGSLTLEPMFSTSHYGSLETHRAFLKPHSHYMADAHQTGVKEYVTVMEGRVEVRVGDRIYSLEQYDSIQFPADQPHGYSNLEETEAVLHFVMIYS